MALRLQRERMEGSFIPSQREYRMFWGITSERLRRIPESTLIMHPGPVNWGMEMDWEVNERRNTVILDQVRNGVAVRMSVLYHLFGEGKMMDIINSPYKALTVKKISIALIFVSLGLALYSLFTYIAYFSSGLDIFRVWEIHRFFPIPTWAKTFPEFIAERGGDVFFRTDFDRFNLAGKALWFLGIYLLVFSYFCAGIGISRLNLEEKRGDPFYPFLDALMESFKKSGLFITTTLTLLSSFLLLLFFHLLFSFTANFKPLFYPTAIILILAFPFLFILSAMFLYMLVGFLVGIIYGPITATSFEGDTFDIFYEGFYGPEREALQSPIP